MTLSATMSIAVSGMQASSRQISATANNVANALTPGYARQVTSLETRPGGGVAATVNSAPVTEIDKDFSVDLATEILDLSMAEQTFKANAAVFETGADMWDVLMTMVKD